MGDMCKSLIQWFQTINVIAPHSSAEELSDGVAMAQALNQFAPDFFTGVWLSKIKVDVGANWRLKMSNLKKVLEALYDYYIDILSYSLAEFPRPDAMHIAEKQESAELERLLQLILGCAVNCLNKQDYIREIMCLEESLQANIMRALQELESICQGPSISKNSINIANFDCKILQEERDRYAQRCFEMEKKTMLLLEEKTNLRGEVSKLQDDLRRLELASTIGDDGISLGPVQTGSARYHDMRKQLDHLKEELLQSETSREDLRLKSLHQETEIQMLQQRIEELNKTTAEFLKLKDEIDVLREADEKLKVCEAQVKTYKKKLEDYTDLKKQLKLLDERSTEYQVQNAQFEEDAKKCSALRGQIELYKKEVQDLHMKLDKEMSKNLKLQFESKTMEETIFSLQLAKDGLLKERNNLRESLDELKCGQLSHCSGALQLDESINQNSGLQNKITQLENTLASREHELLLLDAKYRKCVERAKDIIKNMDPRTIQDVNIMEHIQDLADCRKLEITAMEENLMATAFYRLCADTQRDVIDSKLAMLLGQGQTFLSRQRQSGPKNTSTVKEK